jgi:hypothetical protein
MADDETKQEIAAARVALESAIDNLRQLCGKEPICTSTNEECIAPERPFCSFCGKGTNEVRRMIQGKTAHICNQCVALCHDICEVR